MPHVFRFRSESMKRDPDEATQDRLRELGLEGWEVITVLPGSHEDPTDSHQVTYFFKRDASTDIGL